MRIVFSWKTNVNLREDAILSALLLVFLLCGFGGLFHFLAGDEGNCLLPNSRFAKFPSPAIYLKIWKALYSNGWLVGRNTFDILMLLWPWKMLKLSVGPSVSTVCFCNVLDWTGLDWTLLTPWNPKKI